ncbi:MAG: glycosyltransferase [Pseudobdellovibrionaceae bacterium]
MSMEFDKNLSTEGLLPMVDNKMSFESPSFCVVLPMYNEEVNARSCVLTIYNHLKTKNLRFGIVAVDDGSRDKTQALLSELLPEVPCLILEVHSVNQGYGAANLTGSRRAFNEGFEYVLFMDGDLTQRVTYIDDFMVEMKKGTDFIKATRYSKGGGVTGVPFKRRLVSYLGNKLARMFFNLPLHDYTNGFRAIKTEYIPHLHCTERGFAYLVEEVAQVKKLAKTYGEVPYILTVRAEKESISKFSYSLKTYINYLKHLVKK